jgi:hypothetical protein
VIVAVNPLQERLSSCLAQHDGLYVTYTIIPNDVGSKLELSVTHATGQVGTLNVGASWEEQGIAANFFDAAILISAFGNQTPEQFIPEVGRLLAPEGYLFFIGPLPSTDHSKDAKVALHSMLSPLSFACLAQTYIIGEQERVYAEAIRESNGSLYSPEMDVMVKYSAQGVSHLQECLNSLSATSSLTVWITAKCGIDSDELVGISRVLRKEYPNWDVKAVIYPASWSQEEVGPMLASLPKGLIGDNEFTLTEQGEVLVPRLIRIPPVITRDPPSTTLATAPSLASRVEIQHAISVEGVDAFFGTVGQKTVLGLAREVVAPCTVLVDSASIYTCTERKQIPSTGILQLLPGILVSVLGPSLELFLQPERLQTSKVLLTHPTSWITMVVQLFYEALGLDVITFQPGDTPSSISFCGNGMFYDVIISGYKERGANQLLSLLLRQGGRLFRYASEDTSLARIVHEEPTLVGTALRVAFERISDNGIDTGRLFPKLYQLEEPIRLAQFSDIFKSDRSYVLLGGLGSLGPHVVQWMYEVSKPEISC